MRYAIAVLAFLGVGMASSLSRPLDCRTVEGEARGHALKDELWKLYKELRATGKLGSPSTDISETVLPYVPPGTSFCDAETTLRAAGFVVGSFPTSDRASDPNRPWQWYGVVARISSFAESFPFKVSLYVTLLPPSPGDYTSVEKVTARFFVSGP